MITSNISLVIVDEGENQTANTLTPHVCLIHLFNLFTETDIVSGSDYQESCDTFSSSAGSEEQSTFISVYATPIASRLNGIVPEFNWTATDVFAAQALCGYETVIKNESSWCSVFGEDEWLGYEYGMYHGSITLSSRTNCPIWYSKRLGISSSTWLWL